MQRTAWYLTIIGVSLLAATTGQAKGQRFIGFNGPDTSGQWANQTPVQSDPAQTGIGVNDVTPIQQPDADYVGRTTLFDITVPDLTSVSSLTAGDCTVTFTPPLQARTVGASWASWGSPPDTEGATPRILYSNGATSIALALNADCAAGTVGFEAEPNPFQVLDMTATYFSDSTSLGAITRPVDGQSGARLFAADSDTPITRVTFSSSADFAIGRIRFALPAGGAVLFGTVTDADTGNPITGARIRAVGNVTRSGTSGMDGTYRVTMPDGSYDVTASAFGYVSDTESVTVSSKTPTQLDFALTAAASFALSGTVTNSATGLPIQGATVRVQSTPLPPATTDVGGAYAFPMVPAGTYSVQATAPGFLPSMQSVVIDQDVVVDFALDSAAACDHVAGNLVSNCGFETGTFASWTRSGDMSFTSIDAASAHSGSFGLDTGPTGDLGFIAQNLATTAGGSYSLCYWLSNLGGTPSRFTVSWDGAVIQDSADLPASSYTQTCVDVVASGDTTELKFGFLQVPSFFYFDDVSVAPQ